jgi:hypothetical protein
MGLKTINKVYLIFNAIRIFFALLYICVGISELYEIKNDTETYERVYTGEFLGKYGYNSLDELKTSHYVSISIIIIYVLLVVLHLSKLKKWKILTWVLRIADIVVIICFVYSLYCIRQL